MRVNFSEVYLQNMPIWSFPYYWHAAMHTWTDGINKLYMYRTHSQIIKSQSVNLVNYSCRKTAWAKERTTLLQKLEVLDLGLISCIEEFKLLPVTVELRGFAAQEQVNLDMWYLRHSPHLTNSS